MKNGVKKPNKLVGKIFMCIAYFVLLSAFILATVIVLGWCVNGGNILTIVAFISLLIIDICITIMFLATWEELFESEGEQ